MLKQKLMDRVNGVSTQVKIAGTTALVSCAAAVPAFATDEADAVTTALSTGLTSAAATMTNIVVTAVPIILGVVGTVMAVKFGIRFFKGLAK